MTLRLLDGYYHGHRPGCSPWEAGEVRDVPEETAEYLLGTFPERFEVVAVAEAVTAPPLDRALKSPPRARGDRAGGR